MGVSVTYRGVSYPSIKALAQATGRDYALLRTRKHHGWSIEDAVETPSGCRQSINRVTDHKGNVFNTKKEMSEYWHAEYPLVRARLSDNWDVERALTEPAGTTPSSSKKIVYRGVEYTSLAELCRVKNCARGLVVSRLHYGWSIEDAVETPSGAPRPSNRFKDPFGNVFRSMRALCSFWGQGQTTYKKRLEAGWNEASALLFHGQAKGGKPVNMELVGVLVHNQALPDSPHVDPDGLRTILECDTKLTIQDVIAASRDNKRLSIVSLMQAKNENLKGSRGACTSALNTTTKSHTTRKALVC